MSIDLETVILMGTYRVGFMPPKRGSLAPGELYIELVPPAGGGMPRMWVGAIDATGDIALLVPEIAAPINLDVPLVYQEGAEAKTTDGNWIGEPTAYAYQWQLDGADVGDGTNVYTVVTPDDVGKSLLCIVSATNADGTTAAPPSNAIVLT
jgi:hypothetical protein